MPAWLTAPDPPLVHEDGLPDPGATIGRHVAWVCVRGIPLSHGDWTRTHEGQCPPGCRPLRIGAPVAMGSTHAWWTPETDPRIRQAIREAIDRAGGAPLDIPSEREVILPLRLSGDPYA